jgi:hypothetical protein
VSCVCARTCVRAHATCVHARPLACPRKVSKGRSPGPGALASDVLPLLALVASVMGLLIVQAGMRTRQTERIPSRDTQTP